MAARRVAAELGMAIVAPDTSPQGDHVADDESYDHSYFFIASFIDQHLRFHGGHLECVPLSAA